MSWNHAARFALVCAALVVVFVCKSETTATTIKFGSAMEVVLDGVTNSYAKNATMVVPPGQHVYMMRPGGLAEGQRTYCIASSGGVENQQQFASFPQYGDGNWVRMAFDSQPVTNSQYTITGYKVSNVYYADAENGNDAWDGTAATHEEGTDHGPKQSLQAANDGAAAGSSSAGYPVVLVAPGVYSNGVTTTYGEGTNYPCKRRLYSNKVIGFIATAGPERTFIVGAPDPDTGGVGPDAVSGVYLVASSYQYLQGFTITGCYSPEEQGKNNQYGVAVCSGAYRAHLLDSVVSNNYAVKYSGVAWGVSKRTKFIENESTNYVVHYGRYVSCVFAGNRIKYTDSTSTACAIGDQDIEFHFCTFDLRSTVNPNGRKRLEPGSAPIHGCLVYGLTDKSRTTEANWHYSVATDYPVFADADRRDYRIGMLSPAIDAMAYDDMLRDARRRLVSDLEGRFPAPHDGKMRIGALWGEPPLPVTVINTGDGEMSVSGAAVGTNVVATADPVTVTATDAHPFLRFEMNGEPVDSSGKSYTFQPSLEPGSVTEVRAVYDTHWYVDCENGDDGNPGTASLPKQTIRAATTNAVSGDVIHVAPGTYGELEGSQTATAKVGLARVVVPAGVTLESTDGAESTFIVGAAATGDQIDNATYGTGTNAVRCVYAKSGAVVRGFTLTGGRGIGKADATGKEYGAAFYAGAERAAALEDCIVSNNASYMASIYRGLVRRCRVFENIGTRTDNISAPAGSSCSWFDCIIDRNVGGGTLHYPIQVEGCTIGDGNVDHDGGSPQVIYYNTAEDRAIVNSVILGARAYYKGGNLYCTNCLILSSMVGSVIKKEQSYNTIFTNAAAMKLDDEYRPVFGKYAGIDKGDATCLTEAPGEVDLYGTPRILNRSIDIGAVEYDWRPTFSAAIGRRFTMTYASPSVTTNLTGGLRVTEGAVAGTMLSAGAYQIVFELPGGSLAAYVGGELVDECSGTGEQVVRFIVSGASVEVRFVYTPDAESPGDAVLRRISGAGGLTFSIR